MSKQFAVSDESPCNQARAAPAPAPSPCGPCGGQSTGANTVPSQVEQAILSAANPLPVTESEVAHAHGVSGLLANKHEFASFPNIEQYTLNSDSNPQVVKKKPACCTEYTQEIAVKFLKPPEPPKPGNIVIKQQPDIQTPPAPPLVIRQRGAEAVAPPPLTIRESPPKLPCPIPEKVVYVPGKTIPPPPRKVILEKLPEAPPKPQNILIERWLPIEEKTRRVVFEKACPLQPLCPPQNLVVEWETPCVVINKQYKNLGVHPTDPEEYRTRYNFNKQYQELPQAVFGVPIPSDIQLAADLAASGAGAGAGASQSSNPCNPCVAYVPKLEGDIEALRLIDLDREGLSEYKCQLGL
jgi:hypothetical protein